MNDEWKEQIRAYWDGHDNYRRIEDNELKPKKGDAAWSTGTLDGIQSQVDAMRAAGKTGPVCVFFMNQREDCDWGVPTSTFVGKKISITIEKLAVIL